MGRPPSSIIAEIYMQRTETTALTTTSHPPKVWEPHIDDVFSIVRKSNLHDFFQHINSFHSKTKFTMETEENFQLPFLDTLTQRNSDNTISVSLQESYTHRPIPKVHISSSSQNEGKCHHITVRQSKEHH